MFRRPRKFFSIITLVSLAQLSFAQSSMSTLTSNFLEKLKQNTSLYTDLTYGSSLKEQSRADYTADLSATLIPSYKLSSRTTLIGRITGNKALENERKQELSTAYLGLTQKITKFGSNDFISTSATLRGYLPVNKDLKEGTTYRSQLYFRPYMTFDFTKIGFNYVKLTLRPSYTKYFHKYKTFNDAVNTDRNLSALANISILATDKITLSTLGGLSESWNYRGSRSETYVLDTSIGYDFGKSSNIAVGYSVQQKTLTPTGENNIQLFDNEGGETYVTLSHQF